MADINDYSQNVSLHDEATDSAVTTTTLGSKTLLDVNASSDPTRYTFGGSINTTGTTVTSAADVTLFTFSGAGVIDFVAVTCANSSGWDISLWIDGTEVMRATMNQLGSDLGMTAYNGFAWVQTANKQFRWVPSGRSGFTTSFAIKSKATGANVTLNHMIAYRELVS